MVKVVMPYFGDLSDNSYKIGRTKVTKPTVKMWMKILADIIRARKEDIEPPIVIELEGHFDYRKVPDLHNLHKVIGDAVEMGLSINDREFRFKDGESKTGYEHPVIEINIIGGRK